MMNKRIYIYLLLMSAFWGGAAHCQELQPSDPDYKSVINDTLDPYFTALKTGDVDAIKYYTSGDQYEKYRVLLEHNKEYPDFLRNHFKNVVFHISRVERINNEVIVDIEVWFENGARTNQKLVFSEEWEDPGFNWKVVRQRTQ